MSQKRQETDLSSTKTWKRTRIIVIVLFELAFIMLAVALVKQPRAIIDCTDGAIAYSPFGDQYILNITEDNNKTITYNYNDNTSVIERFKYGLTPGNW